VAAAHAAADGNVVADELSFSTMAMKPRQFVKTSRSFTGGMAKAILNFRGR
jgi:hypothetical protein